MIVDLTLCVVCSGCLLAEMIMMMIRYLVAH